MRNASARRAVIWLIPAFLTLHNAEEAIAFRRFLPRAQALLPAPFASLESRLSFLAILQALAVLSVGAFVLAVLANRKFHSQRLFWCLLALQAAVGLNVIAHVVSAAFVFRGYGPGLVTALVVNAPFTVYCFLRAQREQWLNPSALRATIPAALVLHGPVLFGALWLVAVLT